MALDEAYGGYGGGGECWRCGDWGLATKHISEAEVTRLVGPVPEGTVMTYALATTICDCPAGSRIRAGAGKGET